MQKTFTQNHLVTLLMGDMEPAERSSLLNLVNENWDLKESYRDLKVAKSQLTRIVLRPSQKAVDNILRYSQATMVEA